MIGMVQSPKSGREWNSDKGAIHVSAIRRYCRYCCIVFVRYVRCGVTYTNLKFKCAGSL
jgi:hypothetical protein